MDSLWLSVLRETFYMLHHKIQTITHRKTKCFVNRESSIFTALQLSSKYKSALLCVSERANKCNSSNEYEVKHTSCLLCKWGGLCVHVGADWVKIWGLVHFCENVSSTEHNYRKWVEIHAQCEVQPTCAHSWQLNIWSNRGRRPPSDEPRAFQA